MRVPASRRDGAMGAFLLRTGRAGNTGKRKFPDDKYCPEESWFALPRVDWRVSPSLRA